MKTLSMRGKVVDMAAMMAKYATTPAVGNANMNARGDIINKSGKVVKAREQIAMEYHEKNVNNVKTVGIKSLTGEIFTPEAAVAAAKQKSKDARAEQSAQLASMNKQAPIEPQPTINPPRKQRKMVEDDDSNI